MAANKYPPASSYYGELTFNKKVMAQRLSRSTYQKLQEVIEEGRPLDPAIADEVAHAMKEWAMEFGATHFTHWFQPQRGNTAEKHDSFIDYGKDGEIVERFSAKQLVQSEPDASSFPSGGLRSTFEARGYTAWDPTSPPFIYEAENTATLVVPSVFMSWTGDVLDIKIPLLRSFQALEKEAVALQKTLGNHSIKKITVYVGPEQEYFLVDKDLYDTRPDLLVCGRSLFGAPPARGQQLEDHYFGQIKPQVLQFMEDLDIALYRRGIPAKTRHNEVAPNQFEIAPIYEELNRGVDHNLQLMAIMDQVAVEHGFKLLIHEKPFAGVNGSGKHLNWSLGDNNGINYLDPSESPENNTIFLCTVAALSLGVQAHGGFLRSTIASAGNDHRLGANEAPPAIMSIYMGDYLNAVIEKLMGASEITPAVLDQIHLGVSRIPSVSQDNSDRNRTSPIAFTGNKFEVRCVGSAQNIAEPSTAMNLMMAYGYRELNKRLEAKAGGKTLGEKEVLSILKGIFNETKAVRFEGDNYSAEWHAEAERRGLPNAKNTPAALKFLTAKSTVALFEDFGILTHKELESRAEIRLELYNKLIDIELDCALSMAQTLILPAVERQVSALATTAAQVAAAGVKASGLKAELEAANAAYETVRSGIAQLKGTIEKAGAIPSTHKLADFLVSDGVGALNKLRSAVDEAETIVPDDLWPLAKYQELLYVLGD